MTRDEQVEAWVQAEPDERENEQERRDSLVWDYPVPGGEQT